MSEIGYEDDVELLEDDPLSMGATSLVDGIVDETEEAEEELEIPAEEGLVWLVKVPKFILQRWSRPDLPPDTVLGTLRVWKQRDEHGVEKITLHLPEDQTKPSSLPQDSKPDRRSPAPRQGTPSGSAAPPKAKAAPSIFHRPTTFTNGSRSTTPFSASRPASPNKPRTPSGSNVAGPSQIDPIPRVYDMTVTNKETKNMFVFGEKERPTQPLPAGVDARSWARRRARQVRLVGRIRHECSLTPSLGAGDDIAAYSSIMRERQRMADAPKRTTKILSVDAGQQNRMASGAINFGSKGGMGGLKDGFAGFVRNQPKGASGEKATRMPKVELLDMLFHLFQNENEYWTNRELRMRTKQPESYLKEVLADIAIHIPRGPKAHSWTLKPEWKSKSGTATAAQPSTSGEIASEVEGTAADGAEGGALADPMSGIDDDEDDEMDDFEEVA